MIIPLSDNNVMNGKVVTKEELDEKLRRDSSKIYEVIRVIEKRPIFLREHYDRLIRSAELCGLEQKPSFDYFSNNINLLIKENSYANCNIRVSYYIDNNQPVLLMYFIKSSYPELSAYETGVYTITVQKHRKNPNAKFYEADLRDSVDELLKKTGAFEAILVNDDGRVSEGSRSNVFFVKGNQLLTSPDGAVLLGVTRSKVLQVCKENGIDVCKRQISDDELKSFDAAFITGTSNNVLPIRALDEIEYDSAANPLVNRVAELYFQEMKREYAQ